MLTLLSGRLFGSGRRTRRAGKLRNAGLMRRAGMMLYAGLVLCAGLGLARPALATDNRFYLAWQNDWGAKRGYYLSFENAAPGDQICPLKTLKLILGVADGKGWRFLVFNPDVGPGLLAAAGRSGDGGGWQTGRTYSVRGVITPGTATLTVDGKLIQSSPGGFTPDASPLDIATIPDWAHGPADYILQQESLEIATSSGKKLTIRFSKTPPPVPLLLFESGEPHRVSWPVRVGDSLTIDASFRILARPDLASLVPLIDPYGQCRYAHWPGKISSDEQLRQSIREEDGRLAAWGMPAGYDRYGGSTGAGWKEKPTGFFRVVKHQGFYWLVSPDGNPCFYRGVCSAPQLTWEMTPVGGRESLFQWLPPHTGLNAAAWGQNAWGSDPGVPYVAFRTSNMIRKYGADWRTQATKSTARRLRVWGFSGDGKWDATPGLPSLPVLGAGGVPNLVRHPDVFDPAAQARFRDALQKQIAPRRDDPLIVGWSLGNEFDGIVEAKEIEGILGMPASVPARRALIDYAIRTLYHNDIAALARAWKITAVSAEDVYASHPQPGTDDVEHLRRYYADRYYAFVYDTVKQIDPHHLYLGFWIVPGWWVNDQDWRLISKHCDVIGYDRYNDRFVDDSLLKLMKQADKPVLCGEFSFPAWYGGERGFGRYGTFAATDAESGAKYAAWMRDAARNPYCVGVAWFEYRDEPLTGRGPGHGPALVYGEHYAFGMVDETDRPKWPLVTRVREANLAAVKERTAAAGRQ